MQQNFEAWLSFAWRQENDGQPLHNDPGDSGGWTAWGVTRGTWNAACEQGIVTGTIGGASRDECRIVLHTMFWNVIRADALPPGPDVLLADMAMLAGTGRAAKLFQRTIGVVPDGIIGAITLAHTSIDDPADLLGKLADADDTFLRSLGAFRSFGGGWERRLKDCLRYATDFLPQRVTP